ncbi:TlpA family protein disulfide reductase [Streptomyces sp. NPDC002073]|uniref:TlpA family protein disulfide reductase n=1 Tax=Streptomyces sp. NBC_00239 TaxID=2903640 RepID=UPI002E2D5F00|nr:TlpA disulfide reductase family protein [Streptomyces sp. NBC_00239]
MAAHHRAHRGAHHRRRRGPAAAALLLLSLAAVGCGATTGAATTGAATAGTEADPRPGDGSGSSPSVVPAAQRPAAPRTAGRDLSGRELGLDAYRGKVVVLNVWGSWCAPCRAEARELEALRGALAPRGVRVLGINVRDRSTGPARQFEKTYGLHYASIHDPAGKLLLAYPPALLNPQAIPSTLVVDRRGRIAAALSGPVTRAQLEPLVARVAGERT